MWRPVRSWFRAAPALGLFLGCAGPSAPGQGGSPSQAVANCPDWTRHRAPAEYPADRFFVGVGVVDHVYDAAMASERGRNAAQVDIAKQLWSSVKSIIDTREMSSSRGWNELTVEQRDSVATSMVGPGARTVGTCFDWKATTFYSLAVLDRKEAAVRMATELSSTNRRGSEEVDVVERALSEGRPLEAVGALGRAVELRKSFEQEAAVLRALTSEEHPAAFASDGRLSELAALIRGKATVVIAANDPQGLFAAELAQTLSRRRIQVAGDGVQALVEVTGKVDSIRAERSSAVGLYIAVARAEIFIKRRDTGAGIGTVVREAKGGAPTEDLARRRAVVEAVRAALPEVDKVLAPLLSVPGGTG